MPRLTASLLLLLCVALGCSDRTDIELSPDEDIEEEEDEPECPAELTPRVEECARAAPDAVPLATLFGSHLAADDEFLYFTSENQVFRLSTLGGEPEALTPPGSASGAIQYPGDGFLYWKHDDVVLRVPKTGGEPEPLVEMAPNAIWAVADEAILSTGTYPDPSPLYRTSLITGQTTELLAVDSEQSIQDIGVEADHALVALSHSLIAVPLGGGEPQLLASGTLFGAPPLAHDGQVYFGAYFLEPDHHELGIYRVDVDEPSTPELVLSGFPVAFVFEDDALYAHIIPKPGIDEMTQGRIVRAPLSGEAPAFITDTSSWSTEPYGAPSNALIVSGCNLYFIERCTTDPPGTEARLVTMSKVP
jgi:hypothetical protein